MMTLRRDLLEVASTSDDTLVLHTLRPSWEGRAALGLCWLAGAGLVLAGVGVLQQWLLSGIDPREIGWLASALGVLPAILLAGLAWRWWLRRANELYLADEVLLLDRNGRFSGARSWNLAGVRSVVLQRRARGWGVVAVTPHCPRGFLLVRDDRSVDRAHRVAQSVAVHLCVELLYELPPVADRSPLPCPCCGDAMRAREKGPCTVDYCRRCKCLWLDGGEIALVYRGECEKLVADLSSPTGRGTPPCPRDGDLLRTLELAGAMLHGCPTCGGFLVSRPARDVLLRVAREPPPPLELTEASEWARKVNALMHLVWHIAVLL